MRINKSKILKYSDGGTKELAKQKGRVTRITPQGQIYSYVKKISLLHTYYHRKYINILQFSAGNELYRCYVEGILTSFPPVTQFSEIQGGNTGWKGLQLTEKQVNLRNRFNRALKHLAKITKGSSPPIDYKSLVLDVCCEDIPVGRNRNKRQVKKCMFSLRKGLDEVAYLFGMKTKDKK